MPKNYKLEKLQNEETIITKEKGNSMEPLLSSKQQHKLEPVSWDECEVDDIVYCKVNGKFYTHKVKAIDNQKGCLIGNNKGNTNGWTKNIYGKVTEKY